MTVDHRELIEVRNLQGCARCHGDHEDVIVFRPLMHWIDSEDDSPPWTHWALCPERNEPILLRMGIAGPPPVTLYDQPDQVQG